MTIPRNIRPLAFRQHRPQVQPAPRALKRQKHQKARDREAALRSPAQGLLVEEITASIFDTMIRQAGWHSMRMRGSCCRSGLGLTPESATHRALVNVLKAVPRRFDAAELDSVQVKKYSCLYVASATLHPREIKQYTMLDIGDEGHRQPVLAR
jgi:hypothetical protein